jgi:DNA-binding beta-propeller fold protein YncE
VTLPRFLLLAALMGSLLLAGGASAGLAPTVGTLSQLPAPDGCVSDDGTGGLCGDGFALVNPISIAVSPDGDNVYVVTPEGSDTVVAFARHADGTLTEIGCTSDDGNGGLCTVGFAIGSPQGIAVSPDGANVYVSTEGTNAVVAFARNPDGTLTEIGCVSEDTTGGLCADGFALDDLPALAVSPDGANVYATSVTGDAVVAFARNPDGNLTELGCVSETGSGGLCTDGFALDNPQSVAVSPDADNVYVTSASQAVIAFARNPDGTLTELGCVSETGTGGLCADGFALIGPGANSVAVSPDGANVYVTTPGSDAALAFARNPDGNLTELSCVSETGTGGLCADGFALDDANGVAASPDGANVYVATSFGDAVVAFARNPDGNLTELGCVSETGSAGLCTDGFALDTPWDVAVSPDGANVYATTAGSDAVTVFARQEAAEAVGAPPVCNPLIQICGLPGEAESGPPPLAPDAGGEGGPAVGLNRMPDLAVAGLWARWDGSRLHVLLRIRILKPRLAKPFDVELAGDDFARTIRIRPRGRSHVNVNLWIPLDTSPVGSRVTAHLDPGKDVLEARERNNARSARVQ